MKIPYNEEGLQEHISGLMVNYVFSIAAVICAFIGVCFFAICFVTEQDRSAFDACLVGIACITLMLSANPLVTTAHRELKEEKQYQELTEELLRYMKEEKRAYFTWKELEELLSSSARFTNICSPSLWEREDRKGYVGLEKYIYWLTERRCFPKINGKYGIEVYFTKKACKEKKNDHSLTPTENNENDPLGKAYQLLCEIFSDVPKSLAKQASQLQTDLKLLCDLVAYSGTQGVDIHKVYTYYIPSLAKTYQKYLRLRRMKAPALKRTKQELLASMQALHEALSILCERISKVNQNDLSIELVTLRNVIAADGLKKEELRTVDAG